MLFVLAMSSLEVLVSLGTATTLALRNSHESSCIIGLRVVVDSEVLYMTMMGRTMVSR